MTPIRHTLMMREADRRLQAADMLREAEDDSDSAYLLRLLAFELLLKVVLEKTTGKAGTHHHYDKLFAQLPPDVQKSLLTAASSRI
ncbi:HEPN domain-containing protein [Xanthomonas oryzae]|uniref:HEPN domain-containing protein n=1 Tax=Xanthomonas oryzae TaxID=347 RepID=UPI000A87500C|nr:HEPN domain-containing protein [Xanthomonas oryzae]WVN07871.1 HEPN domain-containing protein [Xanthomonas oryzae pv. oryzicola]